MASTSPSSRNKTLTTTVSEGQPYLDRCLHLEDIGDDVKCWLDHTVCADTLEVMKRLPQESFDLIIADPPYNLSKRFGQRKFAKSSRLDYAEYTQRWLESVKPLLSPTGSLYVCCDWESSLIIGNALSEMFLVHNRITWQREKGRGAQANWKNSQEDIWFATASSQYTFNLEAVKMRRRVIAPYRVNGHPKDWQDMEGGKFRDTCPSNFWDDITVPFWSMAENTAHPTQKPEKLIAKLILASSNPGDLVLDPFLGSGTTSVVAKKLGRHYLGIEREEQYCVWAEQRLERANEDQTIQGFSSGVFWERNSRQI